jgi:hypothetical protein
MRIFEISHKKIFEIKLVKTFEGLLDLSVIEWTKSQQLLLGNNFGQIFMIDKNKISKSKGGHKGIISQI